MRRRDLIRGIGVVSAGAALGVPPARAAIPGRVTLVRDTSIAAFSSPGAPPSAVVVGAGIAGMSAAWELQQAGFQVTVLEKASIAGGRMTDEFIGPIYTNPHAGGVFGASTEMYALADQVGTSLSGSVPYDEGLIESGHGTYSHGLRFHLSEILNVPGLSDETKRRLPSLLPDLAEIRARVDPCLLATGADLDDESMHDYCVRKLGAQGAQELLDLWIDPVFDAWGFEPHNTSRVAILSWFSHQEASFMVPDEGIGVLTRKLATLLDVRLDTTVMRISAPDSAGRHTVHYLRPDGVRTSVTPDVVVCAVEGRYSQPMLEELTPAQRALLDRVFFTKYAYVVYLLHPRHAPAEPSGGRYIPDHPDPLKQRVYSWEAYPAYPGDRQQRPGISVGLSRRETFRWSAANVPLPDYCLPLAKSFYPVLTPEMVDDVVVGAGDDLIYIPTGFVKLMAAFLEEQARERRGLYFVGEYLSHAHTGGACASGRTVGRTIVSHRA